MQGKPFAGTATAARVQIDQQPASNDMVTLPGVDQLLALALEQLPLGGDEINSWPQSLIGTVTRCVKTQNGFQNVGIVAA
jgi:hypothetical protein